jgi:hypothetical protein
LQAQKAVVVMMLLLFWQLNHLTHLLKHWPAGQAVVLWTVMAAAAAAAAFAGWVVWAWQGPTAVVVPPAAAWLAAVLRQAAAAAAMLRFAVDLCPPAESHSHCCLLSHPGLAQAQ